MPWSPLIFCTRSNDHLTSAEVNGVPSANLTFLFSVQVQAVLPALGAHLVASRGSSFAPCG